MNLHFGFDDGALMVVRVALWLIGLYLLASPILAWRRSSEQGWKRWASTIIVTVLCWGLLLFVWIVANSDWDSLAT